MSEKREKWHVKSNKTYFCHLEMGNKCLTIISKKNLSKSVSDDPLSIGVCAKVGSTSIRVRQL